MKKSILIAIVSFSVLAFQCHRTYVDDSFVTLKGVLVDASGQPLADQQLIFGHLGGSYSWYAWGSLVTIEEIKPSRIRAVRTNVDGSFRIIHPDKFVDFMIYRGNSTLFSFFDEGGFLVEQNYLRFNREKADTKNVIDFGRVKLMVP